MNQKPSNLHRVSVSSSNSSSDLDDDDSDEEEGADPNRTGETSNLSEGSSYFTNELSQSEGGATGSRNRARSCTEPRTSAECFPLKGSSVFTTKAKRM